MLWMGTQQVSKKMCSNCYCCSIKVSSMNISGLFLPPSPNLKLQQKKYPLLPLLLIPLILLYCSPLIQYTTLWLVSSSPSPLCQGLSPLSEAVLCLLCVLVQTSRALPASGHGRCTLPEWVPLENSVRTAALSSRQRRQESHPFKLFSGLPGSLDPYPLRMWNRNAYPY